MLSLLHNSHRPQMNRFTLSFPDGLEKDFLESFNKKSIADIRTAAFIALLLWALFGILDANISPCHKETLWAIRYQFGLPAMSLALLILYIPGSATFLQPVTASAILLVELAVIFMQHGLSFKKRAAECHRSQQQTGAACP